MGDSMMPIEWLANHIGLIKLPLYNGICVTNHMALASNQNCPLIKAYDDD